MPIKPISQLALESPPALTTVNGQKTCRAAHAILDILLQGYQGPVSVRLWNGEERAGGAKVRTVLAFNDPAPLRELILRQDLVRLAEAYIAGQIDVEGDMETVFDLIEHLKTNPLNRLQRLRLLRQALRLSTEMDASTPAQVRAARKARRNSRTSIAHHYDVSNAFYQLWLDPEMVYSCAYFRDVEQTLAEAQRDKLDYICRKLRLAPGQALLDIGCGWGALAIWAARRYGVKVHGITLSEQQYQYARERVRAEGLEQQVAIELCDYRELPRRARYDRVVSVGMFEHIGVANFPLYFDIVRDALKPGGLFLNHGITNDEDWVQSSAMHRFINHYVFPDAELTRISEVVAAMENAGYEILDVEGLRRHYALTLRRWVERLEQQAEAAQREVGEALYRVWRLYMSGTAFYFDHGTLGVYQVLASNGRGFAATPLRRDDLYRGGAGRH